MFVSSVSSCGLVGQLQGDVVDDLPLQLCMRAVPVGVQLQVRGQLGWSHLRYDGLLGRFAQHGLIRGLRRADHFSERTKMSGALLCASTTRIGPLSSRQRRRNWPPYPQHGFRHLQRLHHLSDQRRGKRRQCRHRMMLPSDARFLNPAFLLLRYVLTTPSASMYLWP